MTKLFKQSDVYNESFECLSYNTQTMQFPVKLHWHYTGEFILLTKGKIVMQIDTEWHHMERGDFIFVFPETVHGISSVDEQELEYIVIKFDIEKLPELHNSVSNKTVMGHARKNSMKIHFHSYEINKYNIISMIFESFHEFNKKNWGYDQIIKNNIHKIMVFIMRLWMESEDLCFDDVINKKDEHDFNYIKEYIDSHINENITVNDMAKLCGLSYSHFAKKFRETYGMSCKAYINKIKIMKIENLLACSGHDLNYISQETGYSDCSHMIRAFKQVHNITPNEFRKRAKKKR